MKRQLFSLIILSTLTLGSAQQVYPMAVAKEITKRATLATTAAISTIAASRFGHAALEFFASPRYSPIEVGIAAGLAATCAGIATVTGIKAISSGKSTEPTAHVTPTVKLGLGAFFGGIGLKLFERLINRPITRYELSTTVPYETLRAFPDLPHILNITVAGIAGLATMFGALLVIKGLYNTAKNLKNGK